MPLMLADCVDPRDPQGRTYREVNAARKHGIPLGALVELETGVRLFVVHHARDCDKTPLYVLAIEKDATVFDGRLYSAEVSTGHLEESLTWIRGNTASVPSTNL